MRALCFAATCGVYLVLGCSNTDTAPRDEETPSEASGDGAGSDPATGSPAADGEVELDDVGFGILSRPVADALALDASSLAEKYAVPFQSSALSYDPRQSEGLELIQASALALNPAELEVLGEHGFAILPRQQFPSFPSAYQAIYAEDLPVFLSADMILEAVHRSYDEILFSLEQQALAPTLDRLLTVMRDRLGSGAVALEPQAAADADFFLTVALGLLRDQSLAPVTGLRANQTEPFVNGAKMAAGAKGVTVFGRDYTIDFSQFKPRGHYEGTPLEPYFRAMIWLGLLDFRLIEVEPNGKSVFRRRTLEAALGLRALLDEAGFADWHAIDRAITAFVGEHDYMTVPQLDQLLGDLGVADRSELAGIDDERIAQAIVDGQYGEQRISAHILSKSPSLANQTLPLSASFAFLGQRYTVDSHVFSNVVYDRAGGGSVARVVPDPLDVAFAALANDQAASLLSNQLAAFGYAGDLAAMRTLIDAHPDSYWSSSLYSAWLAGLRTLSPNALLASADAAGLPDVARTEAWGRRLLNTQLASWAELRHNTVLYVKQSYTDSVSCEFPYAYVEPVPEFFYSMVQLAELGHTVVSELGELSPLTQDLTSAALQLFERLAAHSSTLAKMAEQQRTGEPHTLEQLTFANQALRFAASCGGPPELQGWYAELFFNRSKAMEFDPTIADVHTDPGGALPVARSPSVLHVGTGYPRIMVVTRESCAGPRAYAGVVFSYHEQKEAGFTRLTDSVWGGRLSGSNPPADVPWLEPVLAPR